MSDEQVKNPYDTETMPEGGGLTREIIVTSARFLTYPMVTRDGAPVINAETKQQAFFNGLQIKAIRVGSDKEEKYEYSFGKKGKPSPDGELMLDEKGAPAVPVKKSGLGRFVLGLETGGYAPKQLYPRVSVLAGARLTLEAVQKLNAKGEKKTHVYNGKTYDDFDWFPAKYNGGAGTRTGNGAGNGATATPDAVATKAEAAVLAAITAAGGTIERKDLIRALGTGLKGDADAIKITTLVAQEDFHKGRPWSFDGQKLVAVA